MKEEELFNSVVEVKKGEIRDKLTSETTKKYKKAEFD